MTHSDGNLRVLGVNDVQALLEGKQEAMLAAVRQAYLAHYEARTSLPHSTFLRFPAAPKDRIIAQLEKACDEHRAERVRMLTEFKLAREVEQERVIAAFKACGGPAGWSLVLAQLYSLAMLPAGMWRWEDSLGNFSIFDSAISFIPEPNRTYRRLVYADEAKPTQAQISGSTGTE